MVELKNGETYNGHLASCDAWMNVYLTQVICTSRVSVCLKYPPIFPFQTTLNTYKKELLVAFLKARYIFRKRKAIF